MIQLNICYFRLRFISFYTEKVKNTYFYSKIACPHATSDVICCYRSNRLSPKFAKMCLKDKRTATEYSMS